MQADHRINLGALTRFDPTIDHIVDSATQVSVYSFNGDKHEWEKTEVEGSLFVCHRTAAPEYCMVVMNRLNLSNFVEPLGTLELQPRDDGFLFYKDSQARIRGVWFYDGAECLRITKVIQNLNSAMRRSFSGGLVNVGGSPSAFKPTAHKNTPDILSLLSKAHSDYDKQGSKSPEKLVAKKDNNSVVRPKAVRAQSQTTQGVGVLPLSLDALFAAHKEKEEVPENDLLNRLMSIQDIDVDLQTIGHHLKSSLSVPFDDSSSISKSGSVNCDSHNSSNQDIQFEEAIEAQTFRAITKQNTQVTPPKQEASPVLLAPSMLCGSSPGAVVTPQEVLVTPQNVLVTPQDVLLTPQDVIRPNSVRVDLLCRSLHTPQTPISSHPRVIRHSLDKEKDNITPLTSAQMVLALKYMLKNDPAFVNQLHVAYVKSLQESLNR